MAIDSGGSFILASAIDSVNTTDFRACFFYADGSEADEFNLDQRSPFVSMSSSGNVSAVADSGFDSIYVFIPEFPSVTAVTVCMLVATALIIGYRRKAFTDARDQ